MHSPKLFSRLSFICAAMLSSLTAATVRVNVGEPGNPVNPSMWGVFFEDINFGADGGLYAELIKNRSFEFPEALTGWTIPASAAAMTKVTVLTDAAAKPANGHYLALASQGEGATIETEGFRGIGVMAGETYDFSVRVRPATDSALRVELAAPSGLVLATARMTINGRGWSERKVSLVAQHTEQRAKLRLTLEGPGKVDLDFISLFPRKTWKQRPGGLRANMVQALADLRPGFLRFPGGCIVEGSRLEYRYQWKKTIGPVEDRELLINRWNSEFKHRPAPDYFQTFGLGFYEYFVLCEDLGAEPLPILNCGMACQFNSGELVPLERLDPFIQDALDLIEFANGPVTSEWGAKRAALGHPEPFHLKMIGIGNEQWGPQYVERYAKFSEALRAKAADIALVGAAGPSPDDERFKFLWPKMREMKADIVDEHSYGPPDWFFESVTRYDGYDRSGPKVFMGEYAAQSVKTVSPENKNTWRCALAEAAFMTGMERNADVVRMAAYAPLFAHIDAWQWTPNLIWTDNLRIMPTPSYHVQRLFARNRGDRMLPVALSDMAGDEGKRFFASATMDETSGEVIVKLVNATDGASNSILDLAGVNAIKGGTLTLLTADNLEAVNTLDRPDLVVPRESAFTPTGAHFPITIPANSFVVLRIGLAN
jgi:alpha-N-arabinofuranosidase